MLTLSRTKRLDWPRMLANIRKQGMSLQQVADHIGVTREGLGNWTAEEAIGEPAFGRPLAEISFARMLGQLFQLASAFEIGQFFFEKSTFSLNTLALTPGTTATVSSSIFVIAGPAPRCTVAAVSMLVGGWPASVSWAARNIEKQPACAAPDPRLDGALAVGKSILGGRRTRAWSSGTSSERLRDIFRGSATTARSG